jgi:sulfite reductase (ferredoxin)
VRVGKKTIKAQLSDLLEVPPYAADPSFYIDWHDAREYSIGDIGVGECAGEVVTLTQFSLATAESKSFDASVLVDDDPREDAIREAAELAYEAVVDAAQGLLKVDDPDVKGDPENVFSRFKTRYIETELFFDRFVGAREWQFFVSAHEAGGKVRDRDEARRRVEEAQLFVEAAYSCYSRILESQAVTSANGSAVRVPR